MRPLALILCAFLSALSPTLVLADDRAQLRIELQASMQRFIDRNVIDNTFVAINLEDGVLEEFVPTKAHEWILQGDGFFVLCSDMRDRSGNSVTVDYFMTKVGRSYRVLRTEISNREPIRSLMRAGKLRKL